MQEYVVLLHGIFRGHRSMEKIAFALDEAGYDILNIDYASTGSCFSDIVDNVFSQIQHVINRPDMIVHFVGHSLGGLVIRALITKYHPYNLGKVVMIATPNKGTEFADFFTNHWAYKFFFGPAGAVLCTDQRDFAEQLGVVSYDLGVIAGCVSYNPFAKMFFKGKANDGLVAVSNTYIEGIKDHLIVENSHMLLLYDEDVIFEVAHFLKNGHFFGGMIRVKAKPKRVIKLSKKLSLNNVIRG